MPAVTQALVTGEGVDIYEATGEDIDMQLLMPVLIGLDQRKTTRGWTGVGHAQAEMIHTAMAHMFFSDSPT
ncbi:hypothetical protein SARC_08411 [Sphaeroforma arctica JP610]|uniref:Uncharacterized protein n=1 Tax=Sphaeroforma arctica JP610 TaxID=667725 RepID=A0A0L0FT94_9EUKA|nr:hypothetical protein SARC_08411 [Sphaeroforma arctica JP610]KNC79188.1 hypothetical protein SARC_08411 [Sphaeroforma arctica JP610]|eukprot:XP_014153090.1 hypothetical protein SARC_08411 [Sphaeroforma arctica JP610]